MKYNDGEVELKVVRCTAGCYIIENLGIVQSAVASKQVAQCFLDSWAFKHGYAPIDSLDVDFYGAKKDACRWCIHYRNGACKKVVDNDGQNTERKNH